MKKPILSLVLDHPSVQRLGPETLTEVLRAGVDWIQLRDRSLEGRDWFDWAQEMGRLAHSVRPDLVVLINRRVDVALASGAQGTHLGFDSVAPQTARNLLGPRSRIGLSTHTAEEALTASAEDIDYVHLAPIFDPLSKPRERKALGLKPLRSATSGELPIIAQGGLAAGGCTEALRAGATGIAVTGTVTEAQNPGATTAALRAELDAFCDK